MDVVIEVSFVRMVETLLPRISIMGANGTICECRSTATCLLIMYATTDHTTGFMVRKWPSLALIAMCLGLCSLGLGLVMSHALAGYDVEILYW